MNKIFISLSRNLAVSTMLLLLSNAVFADKADILSSIQTALPQYEIENAELHEGAGLYVVTLKGGPVLHITKDGKYFIAGDLYRIEGELLENETEKAKVAKVDAIPESDMIVYRAATEKAHITVFTDIDCVYCRMLHKEVSQLNESGVTVRYLAYPRSGIGSESYQKMVSVWCSDDRKKWLSEAKLGKQIPENKCVNPVAEQFNLGNEVGVRGTPSIVLSDGSLLPGYLPAAELLKRLEL